MQAKELIIKKRDGFALSKSELEFLMQGYLNGSITDYQMSAWLMAVFFKGMETEELANWTSLMWHSGITFPRDERSSYWIDKHSTGGVGDKPSLILVPLVTVAAEKLLGKGAVKMPMVSGRGLGHTGGTLDKLESVKGFSPRISMTQAMQLLEKNDFFMMGQTEELAPADQRLYALRDVTGTVESIPLIVSSIMSKKLSENLDGILFDVKTGSGAFMKTESLARALATGLIAVAKEQKIDAVVLITRMDQPLGFKVGNHLEVEECADYLQNKNREKDLNEVVMESAAWMLHFASRKKVSLEQARDACEHVVMQGSAFPIYKKMFEAQGGNWKDFEAQSGSLRKNCLSFDVKAERSGTLAKIDAKDFGSLLVDLGGGRKTKEAQIDFEVGFEFKKKQGDVVRSGETLLTVYYRKPENLSVIQSRTTRAIEISDKKKDLELKNIVETLQ